MLQTKDKKGTHSKKKKEKEYKFFCQALPPLFSLYTGQGPVKPAGQPATVAGVTVACEGGVDSTPGVKERRQVEKRSSWGTNEQQQMSLLSDPIRLGQMDSSLLSSDPPKPGGGVFVAEPQCVYY